MKKLISILAAGSLCVVLAVPALAADVTTPVNQNTDLTYSVAADYVVTIPETVSLNEELVISSSKSNTEPDKAVKVRISEGLTNGSATLSRTDDTAYQITASVILNGKSTALNADTVIASFADVTAETAGGTLTFDDPISPDSDPIKAGAYTGTLTFTIGYEEA